MSKTLLIDGQVMYVCVKETIAVSKCSPEWNNPHIGGILYKLYDDKSHDCYEARRLMGGIFHTIDESYIICTKDLTSVYDYVAIPKKIVEERGRYLGT